MMRPCCPACARSVVLFTLRHHDGTAEWRCLSCGRHLFTRWDDRTNPEGFVPGGMTDPALQLSKQGCPR